MIRYRHTLYVAGIWAKVNQVLPNLFTVHSGINVPADGSCVRFYLGKDDDTDYHGDDWNDRPYDCNAGTVYKEYITGYADLAFPLDSLVLEPCDGVTYCRFTKDDALEE